MTGVSSFGGRRTWSRPAGTEVHLVPAQMFVFSSQYRSSSCPSADVRPQSPRAPRGGLCRNRPYSPVCDPGRRIVTHCVMAPGPRVRAQVGRVSGRYPSPGRRGRGLWGRAGAVSRPVTGDGMPLGPRVRSQVGRVSGRYYPTGQAGRGLCDRVGPPMTLSTAARAGPPGCPGRETDR